MSRTYGLVDPPSSPAMTPISRMSLSDQAMKKRSE